MTIFVLAFLMVLQGPKLVEGTVSLFPEDRARRIRAVGADCAKTITGYISGNQDEIFIKNENNSQPPTPQVIPKDRTNSVGPGSSMP